MVTAVTSPLLYDIPLTPQFLVQLKLASGQGAAWLPWEPRGAALMISFLDTSELHHSAWESLFFPLPPL